jgi:hypothetical protein
VERIWQVWNDPALIVVDDPEMKFEDPVIEGLTARHNNGVKRNSSGAESGGALWTS